ncbi:MAG TPA: endopeptidase La [Fusobacterium sp.]|uniref:endopeptidase La n=1 Tax=Fusobacterium sp. TaxID=68766 RepID=UPI002F3EDC7C
MERTSFLPTRDLIIFPGVVTPIYIGRKDSLTTLEEAVKNKNKLILGLQKDPNIEEPDLDKGIYKVGILVSILQVIKMPNNNIKVLVEGESRVKISNVTLTNGHYEADYSPVRELGKKSKETEAVFRKVFSYFEKYLSFAGKSAAELLVTLKNNKDFSISFDIIAANLPITTDLKQELVEIFNIRDRGYRLLDILSNEMEIVSLEKKIDDKVKSKMNEAQKAYYLKEKISALKEELGDYSQDDDILELVDKLKEANLPSEVQKKMESEVKKLSKMQPFSAESSVTRNYIETVLDLPWNHTTEDILDIKTSSAILERDHYGLKEPKTKVLDYLAVKKLNPEAKGSILCLVGPPGVGKTSLVKSIADSMGRAFVRVSLGGVRDEAEIRGHRRTYVGSMPGKIMKALKEAGTNNPVILLDEIDKMSSDMKGDPASAMLEVLDPEQNKSFEDHFIDMPFDLSKVFFVATANSLYPVSRPLIDRMEIVELDSYTEYEKLHIAKQYLIKQARKENGLEKISLSITDKAISRIINEYTAEPGVRNLKRQIIKLCRKLARIVVEEEKETIKIGVKDLETYLGKPIYRKEMRRKEETRIGSVNGLGVTSVGGCTLPVQAVTVPGKGGLSVTGKLGEVMKESVEVAFNYVKSNLEHYVPSDSEFFAKKNIHIHFPDGATPKDGPSAGIAITTAIISVLCNREIRQDVAMTGEVSLLGDVLPIGGVKEKVLGAHRGGIREVIIPDGNARDQEDIPEEIKGEMKIHIAKTYADVEKIIFADKK